MCLDLDFEGPFGPFVSQQPTATTTATWVVVEEGSSIIIFVVVVVSDGLIWFGFGLVLV